MFKSPASENNKLHSLYGLGNHQIIFLKHFYKHLLHHKVSFFMNVDCFIQMFDCLTFYSV